MQNCPRRVSSITMAFVDELTIHIKSGKGGDGVNVFGTKRKRIAGPSGGDGESVKRISCWVRDPDCSISTVKRSLARRTESLEKKIVFMDVTEDLCSNFLLDLCKNLETGKEVQVLKRMNRFFF